jgi:hypothetical protein
MCLAKKTEEPQSFPSHFPVEQQKKTKKKDKQEKLKDIL